MGDFGKNVGENFRNLRRFISGKGEVEKWRRLGEKENSNVRVKLSYLDTDVVRREKEDETAITFSEKYAMR